MDRGAVSNLYYSFLLPSIYSNSHILPPYPWQRLSAVVTAAIRHCNPASDNPVETPFVVVVITHPIYAGRDGYLSEDSSGGNGYGSIEAAVAVPASGTLFDDFPTNVPDLILPRQYLLRHHGGSENTKSEMATTDLLVGGFYHSFSPPPLPRC